MPAPQEPLLGAFTPPDQATWLRRVEAELRGRAYESLAWRNEDGIEVPPVLGAAERDGLAHMDARFDPILQTAEPWAVGQTLEHPDPQVCAAILGDAGAAGVSQALLRCVSHGDPEETPACELEHPSQLAAFAALLRGDQIRFGLRAGADALAIFAALQTATEDTIAVDLGLDPIDEWMRGAVPGADLGQLYAEAARCMTTLDPTTSRVLAVHADAAHHAGASPAQELGLLIASLAAQLRGLGAQGQSADAVLAHTILRVPVGTDTCQEIARLRALRLLVARLARAFGARAQRVRIEAESSGRARAELDVETNLLRSGLQGFAAILGGADAVFLDGYRSGTPEEARQVAALARNQLFLLREESLLARVRDPGRGSYSIEFLTDALARKGWEFLQAIEAQGGLPAALESGWLQSRLEAQASRRREAVHTRGAVLVGSNRFVAANSTPPGPLPHAAAQAFALPAEPPQIDAEDPLGSLRRAVGEGHDLAQLTRALRGPESFALDHPLPCAGTDMAAFEQLQLTTHAAGYRVQPLLGKDVRLSRTRADFARDYCEAGGFRVEAARPLAEAASCDAHVLVLCCADDQQVEGLNQLPTGPLRLVAGPPRPELEAQADGCIWAGSNTYLQLRALYLELEDRHNPVEEEA